MFPSRKCDLWVVDIYGGKGMGTPRRMAGLSKGGVDILINLLIPSELNTKGNYKKLKF